MGAMSNSHTAATSHTDRDETRLHMLPPSFNEVKDERGDVATVLWPANGGPLSACGAMRA
jgi:hypothetical protein